MHLTCLRRGEGFASDVPLRSILVLLIILCVQGCAANASEIIRDPKSWDFAPLQYSDLVVRGVVTAVTDSTVASSDFWMEPAGKLPPTRTRVLVVTLKVEETLRGKKAPPNWSFVSWAENIQKAAGSYEIGKEMLICAYLHPRLAAYYHTSDYSKYVRNDGAWESVSTARGQRVFDDALLREKISEMSLGQVAENAELILVGVINSISKGSRTGPNGSSAEEVTLSVAIEQVKKGDFDRSSIEIVMLTRGMYLPSWRKHVPLSYEIGQRWLCFVRRNELGWYPFAGSNGLLRVTKGDLIYDERIPYWHTEATVDKVIREVSSEGER